MTDRYNAFTVVLEQDVREDEAKHIISAIQQLRGVLSVKGVVSNYIDHIALERARKEMGDKLWEVLYPKTKQSL